MPKLFEELGPYTALANSFIEHSQHLSDSARWLYVLLRFRTNDASGTAWPSYEDLQRLTGWSTSTIRKAIRELEERGWLECRRRFGASAVYVLKHPSSSKNEGIENTGISRSTSKIEVLQKSKHSTSKIETQYFENRNTPSIYDQEELSRRNGSRREGADAPRAKTNRRVSKSPYHNHPSVAAYRDILSYQTISADQAELIAQTTDADEAAPDRWIQFLRELSVAGKSGQKAANIGVIVEAFGYYKSGARLPEALNLAWTRYQGNSTKGGNGNERTPKSESEKLRESAAYVRGY